MTILEKLLIGLIAGSVLAFVIAALIGRFMHHVDEDAKRSINEYRKGKR